MIHISLQSPDLTNSQVAAIIKQSNQTAATAVSFETQFTTLSCKPISNHLYWHFITTICYLSRCEESCSFYSRIKINADSQKLHSRPFSVNKIKSKLIKCSHAKIILIVQLRGIQLSSDFFLFWFNIIVIFKMAFRENDSISCRRLFPFLGINHIHFPVLAHDKHHWTNCIPFCPFFNFSWEVVAALDFTSCFHCVTQQPESKRLQKDVVLKWDFL